MGLRLLTPGPFFVCEVVRLKMTVRVKPLDDGIVGPAALVSVTARGTQIRPGEAHFRRGKSGAPFSTSRPPG